MWRSTPRSRYRTSRAPGSSWAGAYLGAVAQRDGWQPGRYHHSAERRDKEGRTHNVFVRGLWELTA